MTAKDGTHAVEIAITCPKCQGEGSFKTWDCIDADKNPELRERLLHDPMLFFTFVRSVFLGFVLMHLVYILIGAGNLWFGLCLI